MKNNKNLLWVMGLMAASFSQAQDLQLNDSCYFERQGVNVLVFSNSFNGGFIMADSMTRKTQVLRLSNMASVPFKAVPCG